MPFGSIAMRLGSAYIRHLNKRTFDSQIERRNERPVDLRFLFECMTLLSPRTVLDVGTGVSPLPALLRNCGVRVTAIDNIIDYWPTGLFNQHYHVIDDDISRTRLEARFDLIICLEVLQHVARHKDAVRSMFERLNPNGHLIISCPYNEHEYVANAYALPGAGYGHGNPYVCQQHDAANRDAWIRENGAQLVIQEHWQIFSGQYWTYGDRLAPPLRVGPNDTHQFTCMLLRKPS